MTWQTRQRRPQPPNYEIVLALGNGADPSPQALATDANQATVAFHTTLQRLRRQHHRGELRLCDLRKQGHVILRAPLVEDEPSQ
jgi:hypothetical protein